MPNTKQAEKRMRRDAKRRLRNRYHLSRMKTYVRNFKKLIAQGKIEEAKEYLPKVISVIQHTASKGVIHKNEASRRCSRVQKLLNQTLAKVQGSNQ
jgi:small subunit ribosomal protein S20